MLEADRSSEGFEFWSSVEYGTFLRGLVRELGGGDFAAAVAGEKVQGGKEERQAADSVGHVDKLETRTSDHRLPSTGHSSLARQRFAVAEADYRQARGAWARLRMRWRCYVGYPLQLRRRIRREAPVQALVVCTNTFYAPWVAMRAARRSGVPVVHWMFDLFPDVLVLAGKLRSGSWAERRLRHWVRAMFDGAAANVFLGERLLAFAEAKFGPIPRSAVIPVGCDAVPFAGRPPREGKPGEAISVLYCGNFGRMHDVDTIGKALRGGLPKGVAFSFRGNGAGFQSLSAVVRDLGLDSQVRLGGNLPEAEWLEAMSAAEVALVTMKRGAEGIVMPSKTYSAMAAGQAILAVCPRESDLADLVAQHDCGWVVEPGDVEGLRGVLDFIASQPAEVLRRRHNSWQAGQHCYDQRVLAGQWRELLGAVSHATRP